ncbi:MAG: hypothetical protein BME94_05735 [Methanobacteriales archaeon Met13]
MRLKNVLMILLAGIIIFAILNAAYADSGPNIEATQAKALAQDYLNSHNLAYTALTPNIETGWKAKVKVIKTGEVKWIPFGDYKADAMDETGKYEYINQAWIVQVKDKNGNNMGTIYVNPDNGSILSVNIKGTSSGGNTNTGGDLSYNGTGDNTQNSGGIIGAIQSFFNSILNFFQNLWTSILGG